MSQTQVAIIEIDPKFHPEIERLRVFCGTNSDLFNAALALFAFAIGEVLQGRMIASIDPNTKEIRELHMPAFNAIQKLLSEEKT